MFCSRQGPKLKLVEQQLLRAALKLYFLEIGNPVTDQFIVIISSYKVVFLHVNAWIKNTCTRVQLALNAVYTYYARYSLVMITNYLLNHCLLRLFYDGVV